MSIVGTQIYCVAQHAYDHCTVTDRTVLLVYDLQGKSAASLTELTCSIGCMQSLAIPPSGAPLLQIQLLLQQARATCNNQLYHV